MSAIDNPEVLSPTFDEPEDDGPSIGLADLLVWLGDGKRWVAGATAAAAVVAVAAALLMPNIYTARTTLLAPGSQQQSSSAAALAALGSLGGLAGGISAKTPDELYVSLLKSDSVQRALASRFNLMQRYEAKTYEGLRKEMAANIRVTSDKKSGVLTVEVDDKEPQFSADLANAHAAEVTKLLGRLAVSEAQQRRVFFEQQLKDTKENLIQAEQSLRSVQEKSGMVVLDKQAEAIITGVAQLKAQIAEREVRLRVMRTGATSENPDVLRLNSELAGLRAELARMETASPGAATGSIDIPVGKLPAAAVDYIRARREVKFQETLLESMLRQFEIAKLDEAKEGPALQQVDIAQRPDRKSKPARAVIVLATTLLAFLGSSLFVIWRRYGALMREQDPSRAAAWQAIRQAWRWRRA
jgi:tyrosine-protein kinase Etk/Wzc